jgi:chemotaxis protein histidine kinase CheA
MAKSKEEILQQISRAEKALANQGLSEGAKSNIRKTVEQLKKDLAAMEESVEKKEEKIEKKEAEAKQDFDAEIRKLEEQLKRNPPAKVKEIFERKLKEAKEKKAAIEKEVKEDKAEAKQELKEVKEAVKDLENAVKKGRTTPIKKPKIEEKKREEKSVKRVKDMKDTMSELEKLVNEVKELREKYKGKRVDLKRDAGRSAKPFGYRFVGPNDYRVPTPKQIEEGKKRGTIDYEARPNRSDKYPVGYKGDIREKLADGGSIKKGDLVWLVDNDGIVEPLTIDTYKQSLKGFKTSDNWKQIQDNSDIKVFVSVDGKSKTIFRKKYAFADGGMMAKGGMSKKSYGFGKQGYDDKEDERLSMEYGKMKDKDFVGSHNKKEHSRRDDARFEERGKMAKGGMAFKPYGKTKGKYKITYIADGKEQSEIWDTKEMAINSAKRYKKIGEFTDIKVFDEKEKNVMADGGMMAKGSKTKMRKNSPNRFCWTKEAVKDGIITKDKMDKCPTLYQRKKYPAYIKEK